VWRRASHYQEVDGRRIGCVHNPTLSSDNAVASTLLSGENAMLIILPEWPSSVCSSAPDRLSHNLTTSWNDAARVLPSGEKTTAPTRIAGDKLNSSSSIFRKTPDSVSHNTTVSDTDAIVPLSGERAMETGIPESEST
jgi:hypothetical protein